MDLIRNQNIRVISEFATINYLSYYILPQFLVSLFQIQVEWELASTNSPAMDGILFDIGPSFFKIFTLPLTHVRKNTIFFS
jgi:hypothetical protein